MRHDEGAPLIPRKSGLDGGAAGSLRWRLLAVAGAAVACSRAAAPSRADPPLTASPLRPDPPSPHREPPDGGAPGSARKGSDGGAAGPTALCAPGLTCVPDGWCGYYTSTEAGFFGPPGEQCLCSGEGRFVCPPPPEKSAHAVMLCVPKGAEGCLPPEAPALKERLAARFQASCPIFGNPQKPEEKKNPLGEAECCYRGEFFLCQGRPLRVGGGLVRARLRRGRGWG